MKRAVLMSMLLIAATASAQQAGAPAQVVPARTNVLERAQSPSYSDIYCSGFLSEKTLPDNVLVIGGWDTPHETRFPEGTLYLAGKNLSVGQVFSVVRRVEDLDLYEMYHGQRALLRRTGYQYSDVGRVRVVEIRGKTAIAHVEFSCDPIIPGDIAVPFVERPQFKFRPKVNFDRFATPMGKNSGQIVMTRNFDDLVGAGNKVYINLGSEQGIKAGDYFRIYRYYSQAHRVDVDALSYKGTKDYETVYDPAHIAESHIDDLPPIGLGELVILNVGPRTATGMITLSLEDIHIGDNVELENLPAATAMNAPSSSAPSASRPTISCSASPTMVTAGESATVMCQATSPEGRPLSYIFSSDRGGILPRGNVAVLDTHQVGPGDVSISAMVLDDRNQSATATMQVQVRDLAQVPVARKINELDFSANSVYLDKSSQAVLDDLALRMQRDPNSSAVIVGEANADESKTLALDRAQKAREYLVRRKGIAATRVRVRSGDEAGERTQVWWVPSGAAMPEVARR